MHNPANRYYVRIPDPVNNRGESCMLPSSDQHASVMKANDFVGAMVGCLGVLLLAVLK